MPGRWNDDRERDWQDWRAESDWRDRDRSLQDRDRWQGGEQRSFGRGDRVFGERDSGAEYNRPRSDDWQQRRYESYRNSPRFRNQDYTRGGRYYGDDAHTRIYREEYGLGGYEYGLVPRGYDEGRRFGSREADERYAREMRRTPSGGTGGYDYERGYGDGGYGYEPRDERYRTAYGRGEYGRPLRGDEDRERFEDRAHDAGDFFRRTGQKISNWFSGVDRDEDERRYDAYRGARGPGPKGYKRSDERISDEVHQRLTDDAWLDASEINVSVSGGEVTLSGVVESREAKHRAERVVEDLSGVTHVQNNLRIRPGNYFTTAGRGYGDSVEQARMASSEPVKNVTDGETNTSSTRRSN
jgi:osmotically-inducible protein OsmY